MNNEKRPKEAVIADIIQYFKENEDVFDEYAIEEMSENRNYISSIEENPNLSKLFDELEGVCGNE